MQQVFVKCMQLPEDCGRRARCVFVCGVCVWCVCGVCVRRVEGVGREWGRETRERSSHTSHTFKKSAHAFVEGTIAKNT
jgi:hypothetical protein